MPRTTSILLPCLVAFFALAGCAGDDDGGDEAATTARTATTAARTAAAESRSDGFTFRIVYDAGLDYLDPALSHTIQGWSLLWHVYLPLVTYAHESGPAGAALVPAIAEDLPEVGDGARSFRFIVRDGITYSDGKPIRASDVKYAIERLYLIDSAGARYFDNVEGAERFAQRRKGGISGILADDGERTIEFRLEQPQADFAHALATVFAAPVPKGTPPRDHSATPIAASGPYTISEYDPQRGVRLVRNPRFTPVKGIAHGNPRTIAVSFVAAADAAVGRVLDGGADYAFHSIPASRLDDIRKRARGRVRSSRLANMYYFFLNTRAPPFDKREVRQAVNYAIDRRELAQLFGGLATPTQNVLPPDYPSYRKLELYRHDPEQARRLVDAAGARGAKVVVWANTLDSSKKPGAHLVAALNRIGLKATLKLSAPAAYFAAVGMPNTRVQAGVASWFHDYPHPLAWFDPLLNGDRITQTRNADLANADVAEVNERVEELRDEAALDDVNEEWAELDRIAMEHALWAPFANRSFAELFSARMDLGRGCFASHLLYRIDYSRVCIK